jgi:hypothetical protein
MAASASWAGDSRAQQTLQRVRGVARRGDGCALERRRVFIRARLDVTPAILINRAVSRIMGRAKEM